MYTVNQKFKTEKQELTVTNRNVHDYLRITIDSSDPKLVLFTMYDFLEDILSEVGARGDMAGHAVTPAADEVFEIDENSEDLSVEDADSFHRMVVRFLFAAKQTRPDTQLAVAFLCTRVKKPHQSRYLKLTRLVRYIIATIHLPLIIGWDESGIMLWNVDVSFALHNNYKSYTGTVLTLGKVALLSLYMKQKLNTKSSTEAELVGCDDSMNFVLLREGFITAITYLPTENLVSGEGSNFKKHRNCILGITELEEAEAQKLYASRVEARTSA